MAHRISRRGFVKSSLLASAAVPLALRGQTDSAAPAASPLPALPTGKIAGQEISRLILGGNLIGGWSHSRDLAYVSTLARRYNTEAKIRETFELAETHGITAINTWVMQENSHLFNHWKRGGKMKWIAQVRLDGAGGYSQIQRAIDEGATGVHITGDTAESLLKEGKFDKVGETVQLIKSKQRAAGVAAHDLRVIVECEKAKLDVDFYVKTFHSHDYYTAPRADEKDAMGAHDNSWCNDPQAVIDFMATVKKPWIAFKILAAGAIPPRAAFPYAFNSGADFILVGMFDWQIEEDAKLARRVVAIAANADSKRTRPWFG
ncbi:MAG TPA: hypothetical protein P5205_03890 [Candidatus Paceibacterota bacterium]|nr:hypothetical protein [Verrucomicrobiota bacterium]HSA09491.1 hypothetical protein [Candidatus Paceibacterota bacterium]